MIIQILISMMNQKDYSILDCMNLSSRAVVINQCDTESTQCFRYRDKYEVKWINSKDRGLSRSRNMAIANSDANICLISDDDETFVDNIDNVIADAYSAIPDADIIIFRMINHKDRFPSKIYRLKKLDALKVSSWQITFKRTSVKNLRFDIHLGAGTGNGAGEENKFILDCIKEGLHVYYYPVPIASVSQCESTWFNGYNEQYFFDRGKTTAYILGKPLAIAYALYYLFFKRNLYQKSISAWKAINNLNKGIFAKSIDTKKDN